MNRKPDALVVLAVIFGLGVLVSSLTHSNDDAPAVEAAQASFIVSK